MRFGFVSNRYIKVAPNFSDLTFLWLKARYFSHIIHTCLYRRRRANLVSEDVGAFASIICSSTCEWHKPFYSHSKFYLFFRYFYLFYFFYFLSLSRRTALMLGLYVTAFFIYDYWNSLCSRATLFHSSVRNP